MQLKDIISTLMLSDFYFTLPLWERKQVVARLWASHGARLPLASSGPGASAPLPDRGRGNRGTQ